MSYVHSKFLMMDPLGDDPIVVTGSANFSDASTNSNDENMLEEYDEHYGESAYLIGMAWSYSGKSDAALRSAADALLDKLGSDGTAPHVRSFNWQCRSAVQAPSFLE